MLQFPNNQLFTLVKLVLVCGILSFFMTCSSTADQTTELSKTDQGTSANETGTKLEGLKIRNIIVDIWNKSAPMVIEFDIFPVDITKDRGLPNQNYNLQIFSAQEPNKILVDRTIKPMRGANSLIIPTLAGLTCAENYQIVIATKSGDAVIRASANLLIDDAFENNVASTLQTAVPPILVAGTSINGTIMIPLQSNNVHIELLDNQGIRLAEINPAVGAAQNQSNQSGVAVTLVPLNFSCQAVLSKSNPTARLRYRFDYPSRIISKWQPSWQYQLAEAEPLQTFNPSANQETLSSHTRFDWQAISGLGDYRVSFSLIDPRSNSFSTEMQQTVTVKTNSLPINILTLFPAIKNGTALYWRVSFGTGSIMSTWQTARYTTSLDDDLVVLPAGALAPFAMGDAQASPDTRPVHQVILKMPFAMSRSQLTNASLAELLNRRIRRGLARLDNQKVVDSATGKILLGLAELGYGQQFGISMNAAGFLRPIPGKEQHPAIGISWNGALALCQETDYLMDQKPGTWRLPTEAEWEYAATAGGTGPSPWGTPIQGNLVNYLRSRDAFEDLNPPYTRKGGPTVPVQYYEKLRLAQSRVPGVFPKIDLLGNIWEWCSDWYDPDYYANCGDPATNPLGPAEITAERIHELDGLGQLPSRVVRGGAWNSIKEEINPRNRGKFPPDQTSFSIGMRLVRTITP